MNKSTASLLTILVILILDQALKVYIKTSIHYGDGFNILGLDWARIHFVENEGMAFGLSFGGAAGKYALSIFRIIMVGVLIYILRTLIKNNESRGLIVAFSMIIAGALGNIVDSMFYGLIFSESTFHGGLATMFPPEGGYGSFLTGKVVDMLYFPMIDTFLPEWVPLWGGKHFEFFRPVFNIADSAITVGVTVILLFHRRFFSSGKPEDKNSSQTPDTDAQEEGENAVTAG